MDTERVSGRKWGVKLGIVEIVDLFSCNFILRKTKLLEKIKKSILKRTTKS